MKIIRGGLNGRILSRREAMMEWGVADLLAEIDQNNPYFINLAKLYLLICSNHSNSDFDLFMDKVWPNAANWQDNKRRS